MIKKTIKYTDYNGDEREEDFYFNLTKAEIMEMQLNQDGGLAAKIQEIVKAKDVPAIIRVFKDLLLKSYGKKSDDGRFFIKNAKLREEFEESPAFSEIYMELATDADKASEFVNGIIPPQLKEQMNKPAIADKK